MTSILAGIEDREKRATKGPWVRSGVREKLAIEDALSVGPDGWWIAALPIGRTYKTQADAIADAEFIAHAREDIPYLLSQLRAQKARIEELEGHIRSLVTGVDAHAVEMNSAEIEIDRGDGLIEPHPWHEEWLAISRTLTKGEGK